MSKARGIYLNDLSSSLAIKTSLALCQTKYRFDWRRESLAVLRGTWQTSVLPEGTLLKWELFVLLLGVSAVPAQVPLLPLPEMLFLRLCSPGWRRDFKCAGIWFVLKGSFFYSIPSLLWFQTQTMVSLAPVDTSAHTSFRKHQWLSLASVSKGIVFWHWRFFFFITAYYTFEGNTSPD